MEHPESDERPESNASPATKIAVMRALARHGGSQRIGPLLEQSGLSVDELCAVLNELAHCRWLGIAWRHVQRQSGPERLRCVDRITATRYGCARVLPPKANPRDRRDRTQPRPTSKGWRCHVCGNIVD